MSQSMRASHNTSTMNMIISANNHDNAEHTANDDRYHDDITLGAQNIKRVLQMRK
jgi:hypothetical protein